MKRLSEKEILKQNTIDLEYCSLLERDGIVTLDELSELIPGYIHLNDKQTLGIVYYGQDVLNIFNKSLSEIQKEGRDFIDAISDKKSQQIFSTSLINYSLTGNQQKTFSFIQRLRINAQAEYKMYYTTSRHYRDNENLLSYTQPLQMLHDNSFLKEIVEERYSFFNNNFHKYCQLTERECEILELIANSETNKYIADKLSVSYHTIRTHRKKICSKLETGKLIDLVKFAQVFQNE